MTTPWKTDGLPELTCNVCNTETAVGVAAMPGVPASFAYCRTCLSVNAHPYSMVVANQAMIGDPVETTAQWWQDMVTDTLSHLGISREKFDADVAEAIRDFEEHEQRERERERDGGSDD